MLPATEDEQLEKYYRSFLHDSSEHNGWKKYCGADTTQAQNLQEKTHRNQLSQRRGSQPPDVSLSL